MYIGVDGGGTSTQVFAFQTDSNKGAIVSAGATRQTSVGWDVARGVLVRTAEQALGRIGSTREDVVGLSACLSGIDLPEQSQKMVAELSVSFPNASIEVTNDAMAPLTAGTNGRAGVVLVGGTGTVAVGESSDGEVARAGGYGYLIGDEGSGFDIGRRGLMAAIRSYEARGPATALWEVVQDKFQLSSPNRLIPVIYESENPIAAVAAFAADVVAMASVDVVANGIVDRAVRAHVDLVNAVYRQLPDVDRRVVLSGGLFRSAGQLTERLEAQMVDTEFVILKHQAVTGAVIRAMRVTAQDEEGVWRSVPWQQIESSAASL
ncbi:N-acetylglucosamine kinase [Alicyclobacillus fastidiosus]|uniref:BadF/BadG/BcrA/BcrD ATPase family protein n=1 Tax=Alicyclobacillus fastidiosus TaxID=392011 RepID=A0ABV5AEE6_9BACL|nr:BadF/BadG/BcrA/BcrD ATPase family protein [Alicyclobacillus fastidiosus]WEH11941.1 BadF/BadG/BcrA/BcrD ATPase family protein [Alicyclobacillus fastidiosus]